jgi:hypothetical protein
MRYDYGKNNQCSICKKWFNYLGIASHRAACIRKQQEALAKGAKNTELARLVEFFEGIKVYQGKVKQ